MNSDQLSSDAPAGHDANDGEEKRVGCISSQRTCLLVLGMHRSGTSALTRVLNLMGAALPHDLMPANEHNETGYWEPERLVALHDEMLAEAGSSWDDWRALDLEQQLPEGRFEHYTSEIRKLIEEQYDDAPFFVLKDPRICRFVGLYRDVLGEMGVNVKVILSLRDWRDVSASLNSRDSLPQEITRLSVLRHLLDAEAATRRLPRAIIHYEKLLEAPISLMRDVADKLQLNLRFGEDEVENSISRFVDKCLCHHNSKETAECGETRWLTKVDAAFAGIAENTTNAFAALDKVKKQFDRACLQFGPAFLALRRHTEDQHETPTTATEGQEQVLSVEAANFEIRLKRVLVEQQHDLQANFSAELRKHKEELTREFAAMRQDREAEIRDEILQLLNTQIEQRLIFSRRTAINLLSLPLNVPKKLLQWMRRQVWRKQILESGLFDEDYYLQSNPDLVSASVDPVLHYLLHGGFEGRAPSCAFDSQRYLLDNPDVAENRVNPLLHYIKFGSREGRVAQKVANQDNLGHPKKEVRPKQKYLNGLSVITSRIVNAFPPGLETRVNNLRLFVQFSVQYHPPPASPIDKNRLKIAWVIPDFTPGAGGHMTIFRMAHFLETFGHEVKFYIQMPQHHKNGAEAKRTIRRHFIEFDGLVELLGETLPRAQGDALIATDRFTCFPVRAMGGFRRKFYFVQDYETLFYPAGPEGLLTESTYSFGFDCLCAGDWLNQLMINKFNNWSVSWPLAFDAKNYRPIRNLTRARNRIAFYARHATPRRAVELGMLALEALQQRGVEFEVDFFGWDLGKMSLPYRHKCHGILSSTELASLYNMATVGLVFSVTNHSLVNKEMMACGLPVVDFDLPNIKAIFPENVMAFAPPTPEGIASELEVLLSSPQKQQAIAEEATRYVSQFSWEKSARIVEQAIKERVSDFSPNGNAN